MLNSIFNLIEKGLKKVVLLYLKSRVRSRRTTVAIVHELKSDYSPHDVGQ